MPKTTREPERDTGRGPGLEGLRVLISGASVAGPALAYWLERYGCGVTVVERAAGGLRPGGQAIDVRGPALDVAERMGALERLRAHSTALRGMSVVGDDGEELYRSTEHTSSGGMLDRPDVELLRDDLARILIDAGGPGIAYRNGDSIASLTDDEDAPAVAVRFESGDEEEYDLVVGADGVHSTTRRLVFGPEEDHLVHLGNYLAVWTAPNHLGLDRWQTAYRMNAGEQAGDQLWGGMVMPVRDNTELRVYTGFQSDEPPSRVLAGSAEDHKRLLARRFADARWEMPRLLAEMWHAPDFHFDVLAQIHLDSWSRGRVVLLGDAAFCPSPASGQGTTLAMVGAYVLAGELRAAYAAGGDHRAAFRAYERELREFVAANQQLALDQLADEQTAEHGGEQDGKRSGELGGKLETPEALEDLFERVYKVTDAYTLKQY